jgi:hypothetical protein
VKNPKPSMKLRKVFQKEALKTDRRDRTLERKTKIIIEG